ncbi:unnamed protein product, partial [marine sediment metagenome]
VIDSGYIIEVVFMVPDTATISSPDSGCMILSTPNASRDWWLAESAIPGNFILRTPDPDDTESIFDVELARGVWHKVEAKNQVIGQPNDGTYNNYYIDGVFQFSSGDGVDTEGYGVVPANIPVYIGRSGWNDPLWEIYVDHVYIYPPPTVPVTTAKITSDYTLSWDSEIGAVYEVDWSPSALPGSGNWRTGPVHIIATDTVTYWQDQGGYQGWDDPAGSPI